MKATVESPSFRWKAIELRLVQSQPDDRLRYAELVNRHIEGAFEFDAAEFENDRSSFYWALTAGTVIGTTAFTRRTPFLAEMRKTMVLPDYRRKGLGTLIVQACERLCSSEGLKKVYVTVYAWNLPMLSLRLRLGYRIEGYHPDHEAPGFPEYSLGKILD